MNKRKVIIAIIVLIFDQLTKVIVDAYNSQFTIIDNVFNITYYQNTGAAWSILEGNILLLIGISIVALVLVYSMMFSFENDVLNDAAFGLLFGGILGNLIDRILFGYVRDFIELNIFGYNFPVFNLADTAIVVGVIIIIIATIKGEINSGNKSRRKWRKNR